MKGAGIIAERLRRRTHRLSIGLLIEVQDQHSSVSSADLKEEPMRGPKKPFGRQLPVGRMCNQERHRAGHPKRQTRALVEGLGAYNPQTRYSPQLGLKART